MESLKLLGIAVLMSGSFTWAQKADAPQNVKVAFAEKFPVAKSVKWNRESQTEWEAEFKMNGMKYSANFLEDGTWEETEQVVKMTDIPSNVKKTLDTEFLGQKIEEAEISETLEGTVYEFGLERGKQRLEVAIDNNGKVVRKEMKDEAGED